MKIILIIIILVLVFLGIEIRDIDIESWTEKYCKKNKHAEFSSVRDKVKNISVIGMLFCLILALILFVLIFSI